MKYFCLCGFILPLLFPSFLTGPPKSTGDKKPLNLDAPVVKPTEKPNNRHEQIKNRDH